jgi:hypothetical protein
MEATSSGNRPACRIWSPGPAIPPKRGDFPLRGSLVISLLLLTIERQFTKNRKSASQRRSQASSALKAAARPVCGRSVRSPHELQRTIMRIPRIADCGTWTSGCAANRWWRTPIRPSAGRRAPFCLTRQNALDPRAAQPPCRERARGHDWGTCAALRRPAPPAPDP